MRMKELILKNKTILRGLKIRIGEKTFYFDGAGDMKVLLLTKISGPDTRSISTCKLWVRYENLNPKIEKAVIKKLTEEGVLVE